MNEERAVTNPNAPMNASNEDPARPRDIGHYDVPLTPSVDGAELEVRGVPTTWTRATPGFRFRVTYRNAPANAGLMVWIVRDVPRRSLGQLVESGGALMELPIPIQGNGTTDILFDGQAYSAPADAPVARGVSTGRHIVFAYMLNHRSPVTGWVLQVPNARTLAETRSAPIAVH